MSPSSEHPPLQSMGDSPREAFGKALVDLAAKYPNFVVFDADVAGGTGTWRFRQSYPERFFQFGIAEQNMMAAAAGFATTGPIPVVTTFATFAMRGLEQVRLSIAYARLNVKIVASHPGIDAGPDGASAQASEDLACFRSLPGMTVVSPADQLEVQLATEAILKYQGPVYMRTGRSPTPRIFNSDYQFTLGRGCVLREGIDLTIVACGIEVARALEAAELLCLQSVSARVVNLSTIKPIDVDLLVKCAKETGAIVTAEDHNINGGLGSAVAEVVSKTWPVPIEFVGLRDTFGESGDPLALAEKYGLTASHLILAARKVLGRRK